MPIEPSDKHVAPHQALSPELMRELKTVVKAVRKALSATGSPKESLALVRVVENVTPEAWEQFASRNKLDQWLYIVLKKNLADSVASVVAMQQTMAFQRDHDPLTGIANRGLFDRRLEAEVERARRSQAELSLIYLDIDNFKKINDTYGHACGDEVLKRLAQVLNEHVRQYDLVARIGGEEFCVLLPSTSCWTGLKLGKRLLDRFRKEIFYCDSNSFSLTFSGGVSSLSMLDQDKQNSTELLKSADGALYEAKADGKNTIRLAKSERFHTDQSSLVQAQEKQFLFSFLGSE